MGLLLAQLASARTAGVDQEGYDDKPDEGCTDHRYRDQVLDCRSLAASRCEGGLPIAAACERHGKQEGDGTANANDNVTVDETTLLFANKTTHRPAAASTGQMALPFPDEMETATLAGSSFRNHVSAHLATSDETNDGLAS
ncbi:hypothetical protein [Ensifer sp. Root142]|uniref:hypothetical protein n=1 Tax=Ensifer sp. Root142 TaxID=1736461 RepID=UPI001FCCFDEF|nr:hypothetical protein [Ensifer sp. Root142]